MATQIHEVVYDGGGDRSIEAIVREFENPLRRFFAKRVAEESDIPDLLQEVFLRLSRMSDPGGIERRDRYIFVMAANVLRDRSRRRTVRQEASHDPIENFALENSDFAPDRVLEGKQARLVIERALRQLPERTRDIFILRMFEGLKMAEIAKALGLSTRAVEKHQARALNHLSAALSDWKNDERA